MGKTSDFRNNLLDTQKLYYPGKIIVYIILQIISLDLNQAYAFDKSEYTDMIVLSRLIFLSCVLVLVHYTYSSASIV